MYLIPKPAPARGTLVSSGCWICLHGADAVLSVFGVDLEMIVSGAELFPISEDLKRNKN